MSLHAQITPEAQAALTSQKKKSTISAICISLLSLFLIGLILYVIALTIEIKNPPEIVSFGGGTEDEETIEKPEMSNEVERKPSSPSSSMAKVIAAASTSPTAVPVPDVDVTEPSLDFGNGDDFGDGWGDGDGWGGSAGGGGGASFFSQKVKAERICFVIDYSGSMKGRRIELLKQELARSIGALPESIEYQLIFFAGPAWIAGSEVEMKGQGTAVVTYKSRKYKWKGKGAHNWERVGSKQRSIKWIKASKDNLEESLSAIQSTELVWGTAWEAPLEMAMSMKPVPEVIFFMTDGACGPSSSAIAKKMGARAKRKNIKINAIAMMDPAARDAMGSLSEITGGQFSMVDKKGKTEVLIEAKE